MTRPHEYEVKNWAVLNALACTRYHAQFVGVAGIARVECSSCRHTQHPPCRDMQ